MNAFTWMAEQLTQVVQSKWVRYNQVSLEHKSKKEHVSCSARDMRSWQEEKPVYEGEITQPEIDLQPQFPYLIQG
ncbi:hypothetical protein [Acinetobacter puyangensis]|uniref:hypothetical protein n=1 Tax=Acinetobacter puyangensis TaxID=1096779 RepID=UPI00361661CB